MNLMDLPVEQRRYRTLSRAQWRPMSIDGHALEGVSWCALASTGGWVGYWMKMEAGTRSVLHRHTATELLMVLEGQIEDSDGAIFGPGDSLVYSAGSAHGLRSTSGCVLLVVETAPARLSVASERRDKPARHGVPRRQ